MRLTPFASEGGAISWLSEDASFGVKSVIDHLDGHVFYIVTIALALIAYIPVHEKLRSILNNKLAALRDRMSV